MLLKSGIGTIGNCYFFFLNVRLKILGIIKKKIMNLDSPFGESTSELKDFADKIDNLPSSLSDSGDNQTEDYEILEEIRKQSIQDHNIKKELKLRLKSAEDRIQNLEELISQQNIVKSPCVPNVIQTNFPFKKPFEGKLQNVVQIALPDNISLEFAPQAAQMMRARELRSIQTTSTPSISIEKSDSSSSSSSSSTSPDVSISTTAGTDFNTTLNLSASLATDSPMAPILKKQTNKTQTKKYTKKSTTNAINVKFTPKYPPPIDDDINIVPKTHKSTTAQTNIHNYPIVESNKAKTIKKVEFARDSFSNISNISSDDQQHSETHDLTDISTNTFMRDSSDPMNTTFNSQTTQTIEKEVKQPPNKLYLSPDSSHHKQINNPNLQINSGSSHHKDAPIPNLELSSGSSHHKNALNPDLQLSSGPSHHRNYNNPNLQMSPDSSHHKNIINPNLELSAGSSHHKNIPNPNLQVSPNISHHNIKYPDNLQLSPDFSHHKNVEIIPRNNLQLSPDLSHQRKEVLYPKEKLELSPDASHHRNGVLYPQKERLQLSPDTSHHRNGILYPKEKLELSPETSHQRNGILYPNDNLKLSTGPQHNVNRVLYPVDLKVSPELSHHKNAEYNVKDKSKENKSHHKSKKDKDKKEKKSKKEKADKKNHKAEKEKTKQEYKELKQYQRELKEKKKEEKRKQKENEAKKNVQEFLKKHKEQSDQMLADYMAEYERRRSVKETKNGVISNKYLMHSKGIENDPETEPIYITKHVIDYKTSSSSKKNKKLEMENMKMKLKMRKIKELIKEYKRRKELDKIDEMFGKVSEKQLLQHIAVQFHEFLRSEEDISRETALKLIDRASFKLQITK